MLLLTDNAVGSVCSCMLKMVEAINEKVYILTCLLVHLLKYILDRAYIICLSATHCPTKQTFTTLMLGELHRRCSKIKPVKKTIHL